MANPWFESVAEAERRAAKRLPPFVSQALRAGSEKGVSYADNISAFSELGLAPHVAGLKGTRDLATTVMGQPVSMPVVISPVGVQAVHPEGEMAVARAAAARDTVVGLSSFASKPVEDVVVANPKAFFQVYWMGSREAMVARLERAKAAGVVGIIVTLDWSWSHSRDWGSPAIPERIDLKAFAKFAPQAMTRPRWSYQYLRAGLPDLKTPNVVPLGADSPAFFGAYGEWMQTPPPSWEDIRWLREQWDGPFMIKG